MICLGQLCIGVLDPIVSHAAEIIGCVLGLYAVQLVAKGILCVKLFNAVEELAGIVCAECLGIADRHNACQSVEGIQSSLFTLYAGVEVSTQVAVEDALCQSILSDLDSPVGACELAVDAIAQCDQQHLSELVACQCIGGAEIAVAVAADDALACAIGDKACAPAAGCYILKGCNRCGKSLCALLAQHQIRNDLCALLTGKYVLGVELAVGTLEDAQRCQKVDCLEMCDLVVIAVILDVHRAGRDHKAQYHSERKNECKVTLQKFHVCVLLIFYFCART